MTSALIDCAEHTDAELFIVEGPAAADALRSLRDRQRQAIVPMQGKIPNARRTSEKKLLQHQQIADLLHSLHPMQQVVLDFDDFRYSRVLLLNDPDIDGMHAGMLLILFLYLHLPALIQQDRLYSVPVPLHGLYEQEKCVGQVFSDTQLQARRLQLESEGVAVTTRRFKSVASVDTDLLTRCLSADYEHRQQLSLADCRQLCAPFIG